MSLAQRSSRLSIPLLLAGACLALCQCDGSKASNQRHDAGGDLRLEVPDMSVADSGLKPAGQSDVQPEGQFDTGRDSQDAGMGVDALGDMASESVADAAAKLDLATGDGAARVDLAVADLSVVDLAIIGGDIAPEAARDLASESAVAGDAAADARPVSFDLASVEASGQCNNLDDSVAPLHDEVYVDGPVPTPMGGAIEDGLYYESAAEIYSTSNPAGPAGSKRRLVMRIAGATIEAAYWDTSNSEHHWESDTVGTASADAGIGMILLTQSCLSSKTSSHLSMEMGYSATGSGPGATLKFLYPPIILPGPGTQSIVLTLTRQ